MLLMRGILYKICIAVVISQVRSEDYDYGSEEANDDSETKDQPDYTKFYSVDTSKPLINQVEAKKTGFASPTEFNYFYEGPEGAEKEEEEPSKKSKPFTAFDGYAPLQAASGHDGVSRDFYDKTPKTKKDRKQALHAEEESESEVAPGPHYISHQVPVPLKFQDEIKSASRDEKETVAAKPTTEDVQKHVKEEEEEIDYVKKTEDEINKIRMETLPSFGKKVVDYNVGKSSSTVSQIPTASTLFETSKIGIAESFNPQEEEALSSKYLEMLASTPSPYYRYKPHFGSYSDSNKPAASTADPKNCRKIDKEGSENMNCFVCEDATNNEKFTQCSYVAEPSEPVSYYAGTSERYSGGAKTPYAYRFRRSPRKEEKEEDPYEEVRRRSLAIISKFDEEHEAAESERKKDFLYKPYGGQGSVDVSYSEAASANLAKNPENCQKVEKDDGNTCTVCKDPKTGGNFESCAYSEKPKAQKYAYVAEKSYDTDEETNPEPVVEKSNYRSRRSPRSHDPYGDFKDSGDFYSGYDFGPYDTESYAETQPDPLKLDPADCKKVDREGMTCTVCTDAKTGGNFEQCSYTSAPKEHKYAYVAEKKYDVDVPGEAEESKKVETGSGEKSNPQSKHSEGASQEVQGSNSYEEKTSPSSAEDKSAEESKDSKDYNYYYPEHDKQASASDVDPYAYSASQAEDKKPEDVGGGFDAYHFKLFPELNRAASNQEQKEEPYEDPNKQDVEDVLAEFAKKDRSQCKKAEKNGMTCFLCVDKNKIQHEECMYIQESKPKASHVAYHEVQRLKDEPEGEKGAAGTEHANDALHETAETQQATTVASTQYPEQTASASEGVSKVAPLKPKKTYFKKKKRILKRSSRSNKDPMSNIDPMMAAASAMDSERIEEAPATAETTDSEKLGEDTERLEDSETTPKTPKEFDVGQDEGAFSAETKPVYSKTFDTNLPKYMVEKSEFEKEFDEAAGFTS